MADATVVNRAEKIRAQLIQHDYCYHVLDSPIITDGQYDQMMRELREFEEKYPELIQPESPTQRIAQAPSEKFVSANHMLSMLSLSNVFNLDEFLAWHHRVTNLLEQPDVSLVCELKIDGLAVSLIYEEGKFIRGATRGDGQTGEDVTNNIRTISSVPLVLIGDTDMDIEVRGEVYMPVKSFHNLNEQRIDEGESLFVNPRNAAAGSVRQLDPRITASRALDIFVYGIGRVDATRFPSEQSAGLEYLTSIGFRTNPNRRICKSPQEVQKYYEWWMDRRESLPYKIDGIVIKINSFELQAEVGVATREPKWATAYKFPAEQAITRLINIGVNVGRTGTLNPFAILEPVDVGGATIKTATLHNEEDINRKDIRVGDWVMVERAGDVIPQVVSPVVGRRTGQERRFIMPVDCPQCLSKVIKLQDDSSHRCPNQSCSAKFYELLKHFVGREGMDIRGLGERWCSALIDADLVKDLADIFDLKREQFLSIDRMGEHLASNIINAINDSKSRPLGRLIFALGILHVGSETADSLARTFKSMDKLKDASDNELNAIAGVGPKIALSIRGYFDSETNLAVIARFRQAGVKFQDSYIETRVSTGSLAGVRLCITGTLHTMSRDQAEARVKGKGGQPSSNLSRRTDLLVVGENPGSKVEAALKMGTRLLSEDEFLRMLEEY